MTGFWIHVGPNGCVYGSVYVSAVGPLAEDAHKRFTPCVKDRRREAAEGWRVEVVDLAEWKQRAKPCFMGACKHRPLGQLLGKVPLPREAAS
ncbi:hypothetical protein [Streptomyces sp. SAJ15]|uniref:hypothetical protein n=1 Tax=Streptomyces sp. SAJ15 TaxID=2011095 RepID=UPI001185D8B1|nr:hypothetical protein [Streptomyces sp. SAJ15]TVL89823.1 hypothetical protein CD790_25865 [Streptomyces sp. SAJ15]